MTDTRKSTARGAAGSFDGVGYAERTVVLGGAPALRHGPVLAGARGIVGSPRIADAPTRSARWHSVQTAAQTVVAGRGTSDFGAADFSTYEMTALTITVPDAQDFRGRPRWRPV